MKFVAVTSCPTGIAHSEMAAEALEVAAGKKGHEIHVEVQGASGAPPLDPQVIAGADAVIFAADATVRDRDRFAALPAVEVRTRQAIDKAHRNRHTGVQRNRVRRWRRRRSRSQFLRLRTRGWNGKLRRALFGSFRFRSFCFRGFRFRSFRRRLRRNHAMDFCHFRGYR